VERAERFFEYGSKSDITYCYSCYERGLFRRRYVKRLYVEFDDDGIGERYAFGSGTDE